MPPRSIPSRWHGVLSPRLVESGQYVGQGLQQYIRLVHSINVNRAVAAKSWRARFIIDVDGKCHMCLAPIYENITRNLEL
jgi:hypothetical protein